ncbi:MAG TPA: ABC transporter substrate-binding protein [Thermomicrobiales bacterium]|nr:ABC transporter substrate-binding protein [Thermomicrobiales bacterium]
MTVALSRRQYLMSIATGAAVLAVSATLPFAATAQESTPAAAAPVSIVAGPGEGEFTVTHAQGETVVPANPETIYSYDFASIDTMLALGIPVAGAPVLENAGATTPFDDLDAENIGSLFEPDYEAVAAGEPDLIIVAGRSAAALPQLSEIAPTIDLSFGTGDIVADLSANTMILAELSGTQDQATEILNGITERVAALQAQVPSLGTGMVIMTSGGSITALAPGNDRGGRGGLIYSTLGIQPPLQDLETATHGEPISPEFLLEHDADWLFVIDRDAAIGETESAAAQEVLDNEVVAQTTAAHEGHIVYLNPFDWYIISGAGLDSMQRMLTELETAFGSVAATATPAA